MKSITAALLSLQGIAALPIPSASSSDTVSTSTASKINPGFWAGQSNVNPFTQCAKKVSQPDIKVYNVFQQTAYGFPKDSFMSPSDPAKHNKYVSPPAGGESWTQLGAGCGGDPAFCITWTNEVYEKIMSFTEADVVNPHEAGQPKWDGIMLDVEYSTWGSTFGEKLYAVVTKLKSLGVKVGFTTMGYGTHPMAPSGIGGAPSIECASNPCSVCEGSDCTSTEAPEIASISVQTGEAFDVMLWEQLDLIMPMVYQGGSSDYPSDVLDEVMHVWGLASPVEAKSWGSLSAAIPDDIKASKVVFAQACIPLGSPMTTEAPGSQPVFFCGATDCSDGPAPPDPGAKGKYVCGSTTDGTAAGDLICADDGHGGYDASICANANKGNVQPCPGAAYIDGKKLNPDVCAQCVAPP